MPSIDPESWLTPQRLERIADAVRVVRLSGRTGVRLEVAERTVWKSIGGTLSDVPEVLLVARALGFLRQGPTHLELTREGRRVATQDHQQGGRLLARQILARGLLANQCRALIESCSTEDDGALSCRRDLAVALAPQLTGLLRRFPEVGFGANLVIPAKLVIELTEAWIPAAPRTRTDNRKSLGDRGEEFSYRYELERSSDRTRIHWVAQVDEGLGYDIEDTTCSATRMIEVKASAATDVRFFLSTNEWRVASENPSCYEVQFWGGVKLTADPAEEYRRLRGAGYPLTLVNVADQVHSGRLILEPHQYVVTQPEADFE